MPTIHLKEIELPDFGSCEELVEIPAHQFELRFQKIIQKMNEQALDFLLVFADREHCANLAFLTNLDPRFEEALLLLDREGKRKLLLGNECMGYTGICPIPMEFELYQNFSLMGQDRSLSRRLVDIITDFGIQAGSTVGCAYYKYDVSDKLILDVPAYLADILQVLVDKKELIVNASDIFMDVENGLRNRTCLEELVRFEWASTRTSDSIKNLLREIAPGVKEYELARNFVSDGLPYSCHPMVSSGKKAAMGLSSPSANRVALKDPFTSALGIWGALTARAGMVAKHVDQLDKQVGDFFEVYWKAYFKTVVTWYEAIRIGISAGEVTNQVEQARDKSVFDFAVNTGHTLHLDEWVNSPFCKGSEIKLYSGMALQMDIIPVSKKEFVCANMEDGIVLADETLQNEWSERFPASWKRIQQRRNFMIDEIGINIKQEVLPLSNMPAYYTPYLLDKNTVAVIK
jgi:Xaa-Pro aminopeptidase